MSQSITSSAFVPVDVGKNVNWFAVYAGVDLSPTVEPRKVRTNRAGLEQLTGVLDELLTNGQHDRVVLGLEPTGIYHENWARALDERYEAYRQDDSQPYFDFRFINPLVVKRRRETLHGGRPRSTDPIALQAIALCLRDDLGYNATLPSGDGLHFSLWARDYRRSQRRRRRREVALRTQIDQLWPGLLVSVKRFQDMHPDLDVPVPLVKSKPLTRKHVHAILHHCPDPHQFLALGVDGIQAFFRQHVGRCGLKTARKAYRIGAQAVLPPPDVAALLAEQLHEEAVVYYRLEDHIAALEQRADRLVPGSPAAAPATMPGISYRLAARYLAYLKHHRRFQSAAEIWAHAGFDLVTEESGDYRRSGKITKKGHPGLRDTLYLMGFHAARQIPAIARTKAEARKRGKGDVGATLHAAHRVNRICYRLLYDQVPYDPGRVG